MSSCGTRHKELDENGVGLCSCPMWCMGMPAGFCDEPAYGEQTREYRDSFRYMNPEYYRPSYAPYLACEAHGGPKAPHKRLGGKPFMDGDKWCVLHGENLQEGIAGFGDTPDDAIREFNAAWYRNEQKEPRNATDDL